MKLMIEENKKKARQIFEITYKILKSTFGIEPKVVESYNNLAGPEWPMWTLEVDGLYCVRVNSLNTIYSHKEKFDYDIISIGTIKPKISVVTIKTNEITDYQNVYEIVSNLIKNLN